MDYLYHKLLYWLYDRQDRRKARPFADRLGRLLRKASTGQDIFSAECRSLVAEAKGDLPKAIAHREEEIRRIERLHQITPGTPGERYVLDRYGYDDLSDRLDLLAVLYHEQGDREKAIRVLEKSRALCKRRGIDFDGEDLLQEYLAEGHASRNGAGGTRTGLGKSQPAGRKTGPGQAPV
jgi:hypothetical protein